MTKADFLMRNECCTMASVLQAVERKWTFPANYLVHSKEVTPHMRAVLTDWLVQVQVGNFTFFKALWSIRHTFHLRSS